MTRDGQSPVVTDAGVTCHACERTFDRIGAHWVQTDCAWPAISDRVWSLCRGLVLGDGTVRVDGSTPSLAVYVSRLPFIDWLDDELDWLSTGTFEHRSAEAGARQARSAGHDATVADYAAIWGLRTRVHRRFDGLAEWYRRVDGRRRTVPPGRLTLGPLDVAVWYACDGSLHYDRRYPDSDPYATIGAQVYLEHHDPRTVRGWFADAPVTPVVDDGDGVVRFPVAETRALLEWAPVCPGYEHKWVVDDYDSYRRARP